MGIKERKQRSKDRLRDNILKSAMDILINEGIDALSLRKIADRIDYTAPVIYEHFQSKQGILIQLCHIGYAELNKAVEAVPATTVSASDELARIMEAILNFALTRKELYGLMFTTGPDAGNVGQGFPGLFLLVARVKNVIRSWLRETELTDPELEGRAYSAFAMIHGLISARLFWKTDKDTFTILSNVCMTALLNALFPEERYCGAKHSGDQA